MSLILGVWHEDIPPYGGILRDILGNFVSKYYSDKYFNQIADPIQSTEVFSGGNFRLGKSFLYEALGKTKKYKREANEILLKLLAADKDLVFISRALARLGFVESIPVLEPYLMSPDKAVVRPLERQSTRCDLDPNGYISHKPIKKSLNRVIFFALRHGSCN